MISTVENTGFNRLIRWIRITKGLSSLSIESSSLQNVEYQNAEPGEAGADKMIPFMVSGWDWALPGDDEAP
jgi:hypothetical protein